MKAIGKNSLASILSAGLHVIRIIIAIALFGLTIAVIVLPVAALFMWAVSGGEGFDFPVSPASYLEITHQFVNFAVMFFVANKLLDLLRELRLGSPFVMANADRFREIGYALLIGEGAKFVFGILSAIFGADISVEFEFIAWIAILAVFVLSEVFHEGARMKEEQELTV